MRVNGSISTVAATLFGASTLAEGRTRELLQEVIDGAGVAPTVGSPPACPTTA